MLDIKGLRTRLGLSQQMLSDLTGISKPKIGQWELGKSNPKVKDYNKLLQFFSQKLGVSPEAVVNADMPDGLLSEPLNKFIHTGVTPTTLITSQQVDSGEKSAEGNVVLVEVKLVRKDVYLSYLANWHDAGFIQTLPTKLNMVKNYEKDAIYRTFEVSGSGMDCDKKYAIEEGDNVTTVNVPKDHWSSKLRIRQHREWIVVYDEGIILTHIINHDLESGVISCRFYNEDKSFHPDIEIDLTNVYELFYVVSVEKNR